MNIRSILATIVGHLGRCPFCMRKSFAAMAVAWAVTAFTANFATLGGLSSIAGLIAVGLTLLWAAHLMVFAGRKSVQSFVGDAPGVQSRRSVLPFFRESLGGRCGGYGGTTNCYGLC
jgi:hypothetical protein